MECSQEGLWVFFLSFTDQPQQAETSPEAEAAPQTEEGAASAEETPAATNGEEAPANEASSDLKGLRWLTNILLTGASIT